MYFKALQCDANRANQSFIREPTAQDIHRLRYYTRRIRKLAVGPLRRLGWRHTRQIVYESNDNAVAPGTLNVLRRSSDLFPKVRSLYWEHTNTTPARYTNRFLWSSLRVLEIDFSHSKRQGDAISSIQSFSHDLDELVIEGWGNVDGEKDVCIEGEVMKLLCAFISGLHNLKEFQSQLVSADMLRALARLPALRKLSAPFNELTVSPIKPSRGNFCHLEDIDIRAGSSGLETAETFLKLIRSPRLLKKLAVSIDFQPTMPVLRQFCATLPKYCPLHLLHSIELSLQRDHDGDSEPHQLDPQVIEPLFKFSSLRIFILSLSLSLEQVDNAVLKGMVDAWPRLEELCINYDSDDSDRRREAQPTQITVHGLRALAGWPNLTTVQLAFDGRIDTPGSAVKSIPKAMGACNISLRHLAVGNSTISDTRALAAVLSDMFPNLVNIE